MSLDMRMYTQIENIHFMNMIMSNYNVFGYFCQEKVEK